MMQRVAAADSVDRRVFVHLLGSVRIRFTNGAASGVSADQVGNVAVAVAAAPRLSGREIPLHDDTEVETAGRRGSGTQRRSRSLVGSV